MARKEGPIKRYTKCGKHGRQPLTETDGDWVTPEECLQCVIDTYQDRLQRKLGEQAIGGADWYRMTEDEGDDDTPWFTHKPYGWEQE